ncbi:tetratricopeptide repeat protein [Gemmata sp. JC717]|uniref:tetratricopeptide repeat protein n=1 Tax=Gemmata algarum TaxID=2975278 RepID=UPI0021BB0743|nr:tetratricopeptide repeat protein [Gemmata algarum]MDY3555202.1 tetratricopeptide repeat protein [Gemmata algarum]
MSGTRKRLALGLLLVPAAIGLGWWARSAQADPLAGVRATIGTRPATHALEQLRREEPNNAEVFFLSAKQARLEERPGEVGPHLAQAEQLGWPAPQLDRERTLTRASIDYPRNRPAVEALLRSHPDDGDVLLAAARGELQTGAPARAVELATRALDRAPQNPQARFIRGSAHARAKRLDLARADLEAAVAAGPEVFHFRDAQVALGSCLLDLGEFAPALELFRAVRAAEPANLLALFGIGRACSYLGQWADAEGAYQAILKLRPGHVETLLGLAQVLEQRGDLPQALGHLEAAEKGDPNRLETLARLAKLLAALGQPERARGYEARYRALDPNRLPTGAGQQPKGVP